MTPPVFQIAASSTAVTGLLGSNPTRFWVPGTSPQPGEPGYGLPYAVWQIIYGTPENTLSCPPDIDLYGVQVDAYGTTLTQARNVAKALRDAFEAQNHYIVAFNGEERERETGLYRVSFTVEFWTPT